MENKLYEFTMRALHKGEQGPQGKGAGAYVPCYASASDYQGAVRKGVAKMAGTNYHFDNIEGPVREIDPTRWGEYVAKIWPEFVGNLPTQDALDRIVAEGGVFFGPFASFGSRSGHEATN